MNTRRGDIVMCSFPFSDMSGSKLRPALVVMDNAFQKLHHSILAFISSSRSRFVGDPSQLVIDPLHADWSQSGLRVPSVVQCEFLTSLHKDLIHHKLGELSDATMRGIDECLRSALGLR